ncbi:hypothetical protein GGF45_003535, partial [Coemansia sp. RSA 551]
MAWVTQHVTQLMPPQSLGQGMVTWQPMGWATQHMTQVTPPQSLGQGMVTRQPMA